MVALTGWGQDKDKQRTKEAGFDYHLVKPAEPSELQRLLSLAREAMASNQTFEKYLLRLTELEVAAR